jgi:AraC-like DNA-binding protein/mannose-6-phosphate isomerase-like protein (cupin superfamily)
MDNLVIFLCNPIMSENLSRDFKYLQRHSHLTFNNQPVIYPCEKNWTWHPPALSDFDLWCVIKGDGQLRLKENTFTLREGTCFIFRPGDEPHGQHNPEDPLEVFALHFELSDHEGSSIDPSTQLFPNGAIQVGNHVFLRTLCRELTFLSMVSASPLSHFRSEMAFWQLLALMKDTQSVTNLSREGIRRVIEAIEEDPRKSWTVTKMAQMAGYSKPHFNRLFKAETGSSALNYVTRYRIHHASRLITESSLTITEIAENLGFCDVYFFSRQFKKITGFPPGKLRSKKQQ